MLVVEVKVGCAAQPCLVCTHPWQTSRCDSLARHDLHSSLAPTHTNEVRFACPCPIHPSPEPTHTFADSWGFLAWPDQHQHSHQQES